MMQSLSWKSNSSSVSQKIMRFMWDRNVHHHNHKRPMEVNVLNHINNPNYTTLCLYISF